MPAPATIQTSFDSPLTLAALASGAGAANSRRDLLNRSFQRELQQMAQDSQFLRDEAQRRFQASQAVPQSSPTFLTDASGIANRPQTFTNPAARGNLTGNPLARFIQQRQASDASTGFIPGVTAATGGQGAASADIRRAVSDRQGGFIPSQAQQPQQFSQQGFVPASGPIGPQNQGPSAQIVERGTGVQFNRFPEGTQVAGTNAEDIQLLRESAPAFNAPPQVPVETRQTLDVIRQFQGSLPEAQFRALEQAAFAGVPANQLIDDARQFISDNRPSSSTRLDPVQKQAEQARAKREVFNIIAQGTPDDKFNFAVQNRLFEPLEEQNPLTGEVDATVRAENRRRAVQAFETAKQLQEQLADSFSGGSIPMTDAPVQNRPAASQPNPGPVSTGGVVDFVSQEQVDSLPAGTRVRLPDGRIGVKE